MNVLSVVTGADIVVCLAWFSFCDDKLNVWTAPEALPTEKTAPCLICIVATIGLWLESLTPSVGWDTKLLLLYDLLWNECALWSKW